MFNDDQISVVREYISRCGKIANRDCRKLLNLSYDEAIQFLGELCKNGLLERKGTSSGTHYVLAGTSNIGAAAKTIKIKKK